jgi:hypothetical protein
MCIDTGLFLLCSDMCNLIVYELLNYQVHSCPPKKSSPVYYVGSKNAWFCQYKERLRELRFMLVVP